MRELTKSNWTKSSTRPKQHFFPSVLIKLGWYTLSLAHSRIILIWLFIHSSTPPNSDAARASSNQFRWLNKWRATACTTHFGQNLTRFENSFFGQIRIRTQSALDGWGEKQGRDEVNQARNWNSVQNSAVLYLYRVSGLVSVKNIEIRVLQMRSDLSHERQQPTTLMSHRSYSIIHSEGAAALRGKASAIKLERNYTNTFSAEENNEHSRRHKIECESSLIINCYVVHRKKKRERSNFYCSLRCQHDLSFSQQHSSWTSNVCTMETLVTHRIIRIPAAINGRDKITRKI